MASANTSFVDLYSSSDSDDEGHADAAGGDGSAAKEHHHHHQNIANASPPSLRAAPSPGLTSPAPMSSTPSTPSSVYATPMAVTTPPGGARSTPGEAGSLFATPCAATPFSRLGSGDAVGGGISNDGVASSSSRRGSRDDGMWFGSGSTNASPFGIVRASASTPATPSAAAAQALAANPFAQDMLSNPFAADVVQARLRRQSSASPEQMVASSERFSTAGSPLHPSSATLFPTTGAGSSAASDEGADDDADGRQPPPRSRTSSTGSTRSGAYRPSSAPPNPEELVDPAAMDEPVAASSPGNGPGSGQGSRTASPRNNQQAEKGDPFASFTSTSTTPTTASPPSTSPTSPTPQAPVRRRSHRSPSKAQSTSRLSLVEPMTALVPRRPSRRISIKKTHSRSSSLGLVSLDLHPVTVTILLPDGNTHNLDANCKLRISEVKQQLFAHIQTLTDDFGCTFCPWWHGPMKQEEAEQRVLASGRDGVYLVRVSASSGHLSLVVAWNKRAAHLQLNRSGGCICLAGTARRFPSISTLITYHQTRPLKLKLSGDVVLRRPCLKLGAPKPILDSDLAEWFSSRDRSVNDLQLAFEGDSGVLQPIFDEGTRLYRLPVCWETCLFGGTVGLSLVPNHVGLTTSADVGLEADIVDALGEAYVRVKDHPNEEVQACRSAFACLAHHVRMSRTSEAEYVLAANVATMSSVEDGETRQPDLKLCVSLFQDNEIVLTKIEMVPGGTSPMVLVTRVLGLSHGSPQDYVLKVPGRLEYIVGPQRLCDFKYIRSCLLRASRLGIMLHLVPKHEALKLGMPGMRERFVPRQFHFPRQLEPHSAIPSPSHREMTAAGVSRHFASLWNATSTRLSVQIVSVQLGELLNLADWPVLRVTGSVCLGPRVLGGSVATPWCQPEDGVVSWQVRLKFDLVVSDIPRSSHIKFKLEAARKDKKDTKIDEVVVVAMCAMPLLDQHSQLVSGKLSLPTSRDASGPAYSMLTLEFDTQPLPVVFPAVKTGTFGEQMVRRDEALLLNDHKKAIKEAEAKLKSQASSSPKKPQVDNTGDTHSKSIHVPDDVVQLVIRMASTRCGVTLSDRRQGLKKAKRVFSGKDLIDWLLLNDDKMTRADGVHLASRLMRSRVFRSTSASAVAFKDSDTELYTFHHFSFVRPMSGSMSESPHETKLFQKVAKATQVLQDSKRMFTLANSDLLTSLDHHDHRLLFRCREQCTRELALLPKFLLGVNWDKSHEVREAYRLLKIWSTTDSAAVENDGTGYVGAAEATGQSRGGVHYTRTATALELLNHSHADQTVRTHAVSLLKELGNDEVETFLLQLVQVLQFEPYLNNALGRFLLRRATGNRRIGHAFFCLLSSKVDHGDRLALQCTLLLEAYLRGCGPAMRSVLLSRTQMITSTRLVDRHVGPMPIRDGTAELRKLVQTRLPPFCCALHDLSYAMRAPVVEKCRVLDSKQKPLWLTFENGDAQGTDVSVIFKSGDDLRQDMLTMQLLSLFDTLWHREGLDLQITTYKCIAFGRHDGVIEVVPNAKTLSDIHASHGLRGSFKEELLLEYLQRHNETEEQLELARDVFTLSCAGYCVATYVLGDRHNGNIMITEDGRFFHIDYGHFLGNVKSKFGVQRERVPFVLTPDMVHVMGGKDGKRFKQFVQLCNRAFGILRRHSRLIIALFAMMLDTGIPELARDEDIQYLRHSLALDTSDHDAETVFEKLIHVCLKKGWTTQLNFLFHNLARDKR
eukprot:m.247488 g.247488  ORF g.247488 m.247488 type:complete len:1727 (-) comp19070_c1_seq8:29-5209(-)